MSKLKLATLMVLIAAGLSISSAPALAADTVPNPAPSSLNFAADDDDDRGSDKHGPGRPLSERERHEQEERHHELEEKYGDIDQVSLPPLVIGKDGSAKPPIAPLNQTGKSSVTTPQQLGGAANGQQQLGEGPAGLNPNGNEPLDVSKAVSGRKSPADVFFEGAAVGLSLMATAALALGAVAIVRSRRLRNNPQADFFYESTN